MNKKFLEVILFGKRVFNKLGRPYGINPFPRAFENQLSAGITPRSTVFDKVYLNNFWGSAQSRSGLGSELEFTAQYRKELSKFIRERGIKSFFDAPCGDLNWIQEVLATHEIKYIGGDISKSLIENLKLTYPQIDVCQFDICEDVFPNVDVWHCRDCFFHLPFSDIKMALQNFVDSKIPYALLTTHHSRFLHKNLDVSVGGFRFLDLQRPPFNFPLAISYLQDYQKGTDFPRYVGLWTNETIGQALKN